MSFREPFLDFVVRLLCIFNLNLSQPKNPPFNTIYAARQWSCGLQSFKRDAVATGLSNLTICIRDSIFTVDDDCILSRIRLLSPKKGPQQTEMRKGKTQIENHATNKIYEGKKFATKMMCRNTAIKVFLRYFNPTGLISNPSPNLDMIQDADHHCNCSIKEVVALADLLQGILGDAGFVDDHSEADAQRKVISMIQMIVSFVLDYEVRPNNLKVFKFAFDLAFDIILERVRHSQVHQHTEMSRSSLYISQQNI